MKRLWSLLLVLMLIPCLVMAVSAEERVGRFGKDLKWKWIINDETRTLTISGPGKMEDFYYRDKYDEFFHAPWYRNSDLEDVRTLIIEEGVTSIGSGAFYGLDYLNRVTLPDSLESIGEKAFMDCGRLAKITLPDSVTTIGKDAFLGCKALTAVTLPNKNIQIAEGAFSDTALTSIEIPEKMTEFSAAAFSGCPMTDYLAAEDHPLYRSENGILFTKDGTGLIAYPSGRSGSGLSYTVPEGIVSIGAAAFYNCEGLSEVTIPASVSTIGADAFKECKNLNTVQISDLTQWIGIEFGNEYANPLASGKGYLALNGIICSDLEIPEGTTVIGDYAFYSMDGDGTITFPDSVTQIGTDAFSSWDVVEISDAANWAQIEFESPGSNPLNGNWNTELRENGTLLTELVLPDGVTRIGDYAFGYCQSLTSVILPDSVTSIGKGAFEYCSALADFKNSESLTEVDDYAFAHCELLTSIMLPQTLTRIGKSAFEDCFVLTGMNIPEAVVTVENSAFRNCRKLTSVTIPDSVTKIGAYAFEGCSELTEMNLGSGLTELGEYAFAGCKRIKELNIVGTVNKIPRSVAYNCNSLERVTLGEGIDYIGEAAFYWCYKLESVTFPSTLSVIHHDAFAACEKLTDFYLQSMKSWMDLRIEDSAQNDEIDPVYYTEANYACILEENEEPKNLYLNGKKISNFVIPRGVKRIEANCFRRVTIKSIGIPDSVTEVDKNAFAGCTELSKVYYGGSKTKRENIDIASGNTRLTNAKWEYSCNLDLTPPVISVTGNTTTGKPKVTWNAVEGAERYRVYRATSKSGSYTYLGYTTGLSYTDKTAKAGTNYYYKVKAFDNDTQSASLYSNVVNRCCDLKRPVVTLKVDTASGKPKVTWEKISGAEQYYIVRATSENGTYSKVATVTGTSYIDKNTKAGKTYYYKVKALHKNDSADSIYSKVVSRVCDLKKPVVTIFLKEGDPRIKWETITGAVKYEVYRATSKTGTYKLVKTTKTSTSYTDTNATAGKTYYYKVKAIHENTAANSAYSAVKYIKAK